VTGCDFQLLLSEAIRPFAIVGFWVAQRFTSTALRQLLGGAALQRCDSNHRSRRLQPVRSRRAKIAD
jgi:hypothetical protein